MPQRPLQLTKFNSCCFSRGQEGIRRRVFWLPDAPRSKETSSQSFSFPPPVINERRTPVVPSRTINFQVIFEYDRRSFDTRRDDC